MNILLINPHTPNIAKISLDFNLEIDTIGRFPPLGLLALAGYVKKHSAHKVDIIDNDTERVSEGLLLRYIREKEVKVVGITAFTYTFYDVLELAKIIKKHFPEMIIVLGGPHSLLFPNETLSHREIDYIVIGEGEKVFLYLLNKIEQNEKVEKIAGLAFRDDENIFIGGPQWVEELDVLPYPAYELLNMDNYHSTFGHGGKTITLCSSRGCPFQCTFCQVLSKWYRAHSIDYMIGYVTYFYAKGYKNYYFFDDLFNITASRVIEFSQKLRGEKMDIKWIFRGRAGNITDELCREAASSGCVQILLGVEDYTNEGLSVIKKNITVEQVKSAVRFARKYKIETSTNWIIGLPTHRSLSDLNALVETATEIGSDYAMFTILQLLPGCAMYEEAVRDGVIKGDSWSSYVRNPVPLFQVEFYDKYISSKDLSEFYAEAYKKYYRRPLYIMKKLLNIHSFSELKNKLPVAAKILFAK